MSAAVKEIQKDGNLCITKITNGELFRSKRVIVSTPTTAHLDITFLPPLPPLKQALAESAISGYHARVALEYSEPWWRSAGLSGLMESESGGPVSVIRDTSIEEDEHFSLTCFVVGRNGRSWSSLSEEGRKEQIVDHVSQVFGPRVGSLPLPTSISERQWPDGTIPVMPPGVTDSLDSEAGKSIGKPWGNIHFIGTETADEWRGYMEGAVRSGVRGAKEVITLLLEEVGQDMRSHL